MKKAKKTKKHVGYDVLLGGEVLLGLRVGATRKEARQHAKGYIAAEIVKVTIERDGGK